MRIACVLFFAAFCRFSATVLSEETNEVQLVSGPALESLEGKHSMAHCRAELHTSLIWNLILGIAAGVLLVSNVTTVVVFKRAAIAEGWQRLYQRIRNRDDAERENMI